jgi:TrkA domain protein
MREISESTLPGIGKKYDIEAASGESLSIVVHNSGTREIHHFDPNNREGPAAVTTLSDAEARKVGAILSGAYFKPRVIQDVELAIEGLIIEWVELKPGARFANKSIGELQIRQRTGTTIVAIVRNGKPIINPRPEERLLVGDTLVVVGDEESFAEFQRVASES